jgi:hypothetical protein
MNSGIAEETVTGMTYLDILQLWLMPQLQHIPTFIFQHDVSPAHFHCEVLQYLNTMLPGLWIGRIDVCHVTRRTYLVVKKNFLIFPVAVNNSIKVGPLVFLL